MQNTALVVGGARGIGLASSQLLKRSGWSVIVADRDEAEEEVRVDFDCRIVDVTSSQSVDKLVQDVVRDHGRIDGLINAAGFNRHQTVAELDDETWQNLFDVHLGGVLRLCRAAFGPLKTASGAVVNISSIGARIGRPKRAPYAAAKAGIEALTRTLAVEWAPHGIRVNALLPGIVNTRLVQGNIAAGLVDEASLVRAIPMKRMGRPEELADAVEFLLSSRASYITGQSLVVDGGALANGEW